MAAKTARHRRRAPSSPGYSSTDEERGEERNIQGHANLSNGTKEHSRNRVFLVQRATSHLRGALWSLLLVCAIALPTAFRSVWTQLVWRSSSDGRTSLVPSDSRYQFNAPRRYLTSAPMPLSHCNVKPVMVRVQSDFSVDSLPLSWEIDALIPRRVDYEPPQHARYKPKSELQEGCEPMADWQESLHVGCNLFHEIEIADSQVDVRLVNNGAYRDVWRIREYDGTLRALKTLRYAKKREFDHRNFDRHRRDALAYDAVSASPYVAHLYGSCVNSALFDYADGGNLEDLIESNTTLSDLELLTMAHGIAAGVADAHHVDERGRATIAHTDIKANQFIMLDGGYKLSDFNRARLLSWDPEANKTCGFTVGRNAGKWRSPEEYSYREETEKVDVWSLGLILYSILAREYPYESLLEDSDDVPKLVVGGGRVRVTKPEIVGSNSVADKAVIKAIDLCLEHDPNKRANARDITRVLNDALRSLKAG